MPLESGPSKAAFSHNVATEMNAGKEQKQAVAIAYAKKRGDQLATVADAVDKIRARLDALEGRRRADADKPAKRCRSVNMDGAWFVYINGKYDEHFTEKQDAERYFKTLLALPGYVRDAS